jgi:hypothetical protein
MGLKRINKMSLIEIADSKINSLKFCAKQTCCLDDLDFDLTNYCGGNMDDAFNIGLAAGDILAARHFLDAIGIKYE